MSPILESNEVQWTIGFLGRAFLRREGIQTEKRGKARLSILIRKVKRKHFSPGGSTEQLRRMRAPLHARCERSNDRLRHVHRDPVARFDLLARLYELIVDADPTQFDEALKGGTRHLPLAIHEKDIQPLGLFAGGDHKLCNHVGQGY